LPGFFIKNINYIGVAKRDFFFQPKISFVSPNFKNAILGLTLNQDLQVKLAVLFDRPNNVFRLFHLSLNHVFVFLPVCLIFLENGT